MGEPIKDGGPAFPEAIAIGPAGDVYPGMGGMALRDYFAGQALAATDAETKAALNAVMEEGTDLADYIAQTCYEIADAMIAAREAKP